MDPQVVGRNSLIASPKNKCRNLDDIRRIESSDFNLKFDNQCLIGSYDKLRDEKQSPKSVTGRTRADTGLTKESSNDGELAISQFRSP